VAAYNTLNLQYEFIEVIKVATKNLGGF